MIKRIIIKRIEKKKGVTRRKSKFMFGKKNNKSYLGKKNNRITPNTPAELVKKKKQEILRRKQKEEERIKKNQEAILLQQKKEKIQIKKKYQIEFRKKQQQVVILKKRKQSLLIKKSFVVFQKQVLIKKNKFRKQGNSIINLLNKNRLKLLIKEFKRNIKVKRITVKLTNKRAKPVKIKRPRVINNNEKGIISSVFLDNKINLVAFKTRAQAIKYQLNLKVEPQTQSKTLFKIRELTQNSSASKQPEEYIEFKKVLRNAQIKHFQELLKMNITSKKRSISGLCSLKLLSLKKQVQNNTIKRIIRIKRILKKLQNPSIRKLQNSIESRKEKLVYVTTQELYKNINELIKGVRGAHWKIEKKKNNIQKNIEKVQKKLRGYKRKLKLKNFQRKLKNRRFKLYVENLYFKLETEKRKLNNKFEKLTYQTKKHKEEVTLLVKAAKQSQRLFNMQALVKSLTVNLPINMSKDFYNKTDTSLEDLKNSYTQIKQYLAIFQGRNIMALSQQQQKEKQQNNKKKEALKQIESERGNPIKKVITLVIKEEEVQREKNNPIIVQVILNILRGFGQTQTYLGEKQNIFETMYKNMEKYMSGIANESINYSERLDDRLQSRLIHEFINIKNIPKVLEAQGILMKKYLEFDKVAKNFPKERLAPKEFQVYLDEFKSKKRDFKFCKKSYIRLIGKKKVYTMVNNIIAVDNKVYSLSLPKKRIKVPTLLQIYKKIKVNKVPGYKRKLGYRKRSLKKLRKRLQKIRRLKSLGKYFPKKKLKGKKTKKAKKKTKNNKIKIGVLRIKLGRRNMFLMFRERRTNKVEAVTTARRAYYRIFNTVDEDAGNNKKRSSKETVVKTKGPIGRYISTEQFRVRVLTQAFLDLRHKLKYNVLDIEIEKKSKKRFVKTIYKKYWYVFKKQGVFRRCSFVKNKAHGQMRKKKARRI